MRRVIIGALALAVSWVPVASPARAEAGSGTITGINGVLYDDCLHHPYRYQVAPPAGAGYWDLEVTVVGPDGRPAATDFVPTGEVTGTSTFVLCPPADLYGRYTIRATFHWAADAESPKESAQLADAHFSMRKPYTRTSLAVSTRRPAYRQLVTYRIRVWDERPEGYAATAFAWVHLEKRVDGRWVRVKGSRTLTHATGQVRLRLRYLRHHHRMRIRSVAERSSRFRRSVSPVVRLW